MKETTAPRTWEDEKLALERWKYYKGVGGADKDTMIKIVTWLLGFSTAIIGLQATGKLTDYRSMILLTVLGILLSIVAALVALLYGGYATWNWAVADQIALAYHWQESLPGNNPIPTRPHWGLTRFAFWLSKPCSGKIAPVFWLYFWVSLVSLAVQSMQLLRCAV